MRVVLYVAAFAAANIITAATQPADIGPWLVTWGTWFVGVTFILRDAVQVRHGRTGAYCALAVAVVLAGIVSALLGDTLLVLAASCLAIAVSETADTEVFTRYRDRMGLRVGVSGIVGSLLDSAIFVTLGLGVSGIVPWAFIPNVIAGQIAVKCTLQVIAAGVVLRYPRLVAA